MASARHPLRWSSRWSRVAALGGAVAALGATGCIGPRVVTADGDTGSSSADAEASTTSAAPSTTATSATSDSTTTPADDDTNTGSASAGFLPPPSDAGGGVSFECDLLTQNCPPGQKCMPWANDGGGAWNATRCSPIADDPVPVDGLCHVEGSGVSGIDDCELGAMCYGVDPKTLEGTCVPMCVGNERELYCEDPDRFCYISGDGAIIPCLRGCDPVEQDCPAGDACYPISSYWFCAPDASGDALGAYGDPCEFINVCDPGLICLGAAAVPPGLPCEGAAGCCTEVCDIDDPAGDQQCAGAAEGQTCQPWYEEGATLAKWDDVGACALPG